MHPATLITFSFPLLPPWFCKLNAIRRHLPSVKYRQNQPPFLGEVFLATFWVQRKLYWGGPQTPVDLFSLMEYLFLLLRNQPSLRALRPYFIGALPQAP